MWKTTGSTRSTRSTNEKVTCVQLLPLQSEAEVTCARFNLVLGLQVVHAVGGNAIDGENDVSDAHLGFGRLASIGQLQ